MAGNALSKLFQSFRGSGNQDSPDPSLGEAGTEVVQFRLQVTWLDCQNPARLRELLRMGVEPNGLDDEDGLALIFKTGEYPESTRVLIDAGADVNVRNYVEATPLFYADPVVSKMLIDAGADLSATDYQGRTALHVSQSSEKFDVLIAAGADINARDHRGRTPLHQQEDYWRVGSLLQAGADVNARDNDGNTPLHLMSLEGGYNLYDYDEALLQLIGAGADCDIANNDGRTVESVLQNYAREALNEFKAHGKDVLEGFFERDPYESVDRGDVDALGVVLERKRVAGSWDAHIAHDLDSRGKMFSARTPEMVAFLVGAGASLNVTNERGKTPLHLACQSGDLVLMKSMLSHGAYADSRDDQGASPLQEAIWYGKDGNRDSTGLIRALAESGAPLSGSLHKAVACRNGPAIRELVSLGVDVDSRDYDQRTPLFQLNNAETGRLLVSLGADIHAKDRNGVKAIDQGQRAHRYLHDILPAYRAKLLEAALPAANAWTPPEGGFAADAQREVIVAMKARGQDAPAQEAPRLRTRF
jgi:ankyrin repeat protein